LDTLINRELKDSNRIGIKIDAQGAEYEILESLSENIERIEFVILENNILHRYENAKLFSEITSLLNNKNFYFFNILNPSSAIPRYAYDCVFLKKDYKVFISKV